MTNIKNKLLDLTRITILYTQHDQQDVVLDFVKDVGINDMQEYNDGSNYIIYEVDNIDNAIGFTYDYKAGKRVILTQSEIKELLEIED